MIGRLLCKLFGHPRGRYVATENGKRICACPRCGRRTEYRSKTAS